MKQKKFLLYALMLGLLTGFAACKKDTATNTGNDTEISTHSDDQSLFSSEIDAISNDADAVLEFYSAISAREMGADTTICGASISWDILSDPQTATITFNGDDCAGRKREGSVVISLAKGTKWKDAGASVSISFQNVKITRLSDNKSVTINGTQTYTNESGGLLRNLSSQQTITHTIAADDFSVTFDNGAQRTWKVAKKRVFTYDDGVVIATSGNHTEGDTEGIAEWGTNRFGAAFTTVISQPLTIRQDCDFRLTGGVVTHTVGGLSATVTFGLDKDGNAVSCPEGNYYYKLVYTGPNGNTFTLIFPY
jgi:hypothetical protein